MAGEVDGKREWQALGRWMGWAEHWQDGMGLMNSEGVVWTVRVLDLYGMIVAGQHALRGCEGPEISPTENMKVSS